MRSRVSILAAEQLVGVALDEPNRRGREANLKCIEVLKESAEFLLDAPVGLVGDDKIEEADIEILEALHHRGIRGEINALVAVA